MDPVVVPYESGYAVSRNSPIQVNDPNGDTGEDENNWLTEYLHNLHILLDAFGQLFPSQGDPFDQVNAAIYDVEGNAEAANYIRYSAAFRLLPVALLPKGGKSKISVLPDVEVPKSTPKSSPKQPSKPSPKQPYKPTNSGSSKNQNPTRRAAHRQAKRDAGIPVSPLPPSLQKPD